MPQCPHHHLPRQRPAAAMAAVLLLALLAGCSPYRFVGDRIIAFAEDDIIPRELRDDDAILACHAATSMGIPAMAFESVGTSIDRIAVLMQVGSALCAERDAVEAELAFQRAMFRQDAYAADDARVQQKRAHLQAARRAWRAYTRANDYFVIRPGETCPRFRDDVDEMVFLVGLVAGLQAALNDAQSGQVLGVPLDTVPNIARLSNCLDSERWWGAPEGIRAGLWTILPALGPEGAQPMQILADLAHRNGDRGVRLGYVVWALAAWGGGDKPLARTIIGDFVAAGQRTPASTEYRLLDAISLQLMLALSDRLWTEAVGYRTPADRFGSFPPASP